MSAHCQSEWARRKGSDTYHFAARAAVHGGEKTGTATKSHSSRDGRTNRAHQPIREAEVGSAVAGTIQDRQLMFDEEGLGKYGTDAARLRQSDDGGDEVDEQDHEIAHSAW